MNMDKRATWFILGFISALLFFYTIAHFRYLPNDATKSWPNEERESMLERYPWLKYARAGGIGPFKVIVPAGSSNVREALISLNSEDVSYPFLMLSSNNIDITDKEFNQISIEFNKSTGDFVSYNFTTDMMRNYETFIDSNVDGRYDVEMDFTNKMTYVNYESEWLPVQKDGDRRYIELDGTEKDVKVSSKGWSFLESKSMHDEPLDFSVSNDK